MSKTYRTVEDTRAQRPNETAAQWLKRLNKRHRKSSRTAEERRWMTEFNYASN